jgi:hypothetical protein
VETLAARIARDGPVSELDAIGWAIRLSRRLEALHALGVAHGSVSPACVIAAGGDRNARAVLADVQKTPALLAFQSPERILGGNLSPSDDVWALAATLYALLTGQNPFAATNDADLRQKILAASPAPLAVFDVGDDDLQHIIDHAFARDLNARTASVAALRRSLEEWHPDRGVANLPPLEDEEAATDDDDGVRTMMVRDAGAFLADHERRAAAAPAQGGGGAPGGFAAPPGDDDDEDARTMMRVLPQADLQALLHRANEARRAGAPGAPMPAPYAPGPNAPFVPRPDAPRPRASGTLAMPAHVPAPAAPVVVPAPAGRPAQTIDDDPSEDLMTVMRTPEQLAADAADPRLRREEPFGPGRPKLPPFEPPQAFLARVAATQKMDQAPRGGHEPQPTLAMAGGQLLAAGPPMSARTVPMPASMGSFPQPNAQPVPPAPPPLAAPPAPLAEAPAAPVTEDAGPAQGSGGTLKLAFLAFLALIVAAGLTFMALKLKGL